MPRHARLDAAGVLHHVIIRGIAGRDIFPGDEDRTDLIDRLSALLPETGTACYAWALMSNHAHMLLRTGDVPLSTLMARLLTGYAAGFNRRHRRSGHLFQNRYRSIICQEEPYLQELLRYIHLNPLRAGIVPDYGSICLYPWSGHAAILGNRAVPCRYTFLFLWFLQFFSFSGCSNRINKTNQINRTNHDLQPTDTVYYSRTDHINTPRVMTDSSGTVPWRYMSFWVRSW